MAKQLVGIGSSANDGTGDTLRDGAIKYNANFDELYQKLGNDTDIHIDITAGITDGQVLKWSSTPTPAFRGADFNLLSANLDTNAHQIICDGTDDIVVKQTGTGDIKLWGGGSGSAYTYIDGADGYFKWYAPYANAAALPNATNHHGMFAHTHDTGKAHFAHDPDWIQLVDVNDSINILSDVDTTVNGGPSGGQVLKWNASTTKWEPANDEQGSGGGGGTTQNLFETVTADTGTTTASAANDTLIIAGGTNISTTLVGDTLTVDMTGALGAPDQNLFSTFSADNGSTSATVITDTLTIAGGTSISTNLSANTITVTNDAPNIVQNVLQTITGNSGSYTSNSSNASVAIEGSNGITTSVSGSTLSITSTRLLPSNTLEGKSIYYDGENDSWEVGDGPVYFYSFTAPSDMIYRVSGPGVDSGDDNPGLVLFRGHTYKLYNTTGANHPLKLRVSSGGAAVTEGVNAMSNGTTTYTVPMTVAAGTTYVYQCELHSAMMGTITIA